MVISRLHAVKETKMEFIPALFFQVAVLLVCSTSKFVVQGKIFATLNIQYFVQVAIATVMFNGLDHKFLCYLQASGHVLPVVMWGW